MSKNVKETFKFIGRNWVSVLLHVLIPAIIYTIFIFPTSAYDFIVVNMKDMEKAPFWKIFTTINDASKWASWEYIVFFIAIAVITLVIFSSYIGKVQSTMKYGSSLYPGFKGIFKRTNENMFTTIKCSLLVVIGMELYAIIMSMFIALILRVTDIAVLRVILILLFCAIGVFIMFYLLTWVSCTIPNMTIRGMGMFKSIQFSMRSVAPKFWKTFVGIFVPMMISYIPVILIATFDIIFDHIVLTIVRYLVNFIFYAFSFAYYITYMYVIFFDLNSLDREDISQANKWRI